jgi:hypothetical protein
MADTTPDTSTETPDQPSLTAEQAVESATPEQLDQLLAGVPEPDAEPEQAEAQPEAEQPAEPEDAEEPAEPETPAEKAKGKQYRVRPNDEKEEAFLALKRSGKSVAEAYEAVYGATKTAEKPAEPTPEAPQDPVSAIDAKVAGYNKELDALAKKLDAATADAELGEMNKLNAQIRKIEREVLRAELARDAAVAQAEESKQQAAVAQRSTAETSDYERAVAMFPELGDAKSPERQKFDQFFKEAAQNPDYADLFKSGNYRLQLAKDFALENGLTPAHRRTASAPSARQAAQVPGTAPAKLAARPQARAAGVISTKAAPSGGLAQPALSDADLEKMTPTELDRLLAAVR